MERICSELGRGIAPTDAKTSPGTARRERLSGVVFGIV